MRPAPEARAAGLAEQAVRDRASAPPGEPLLLHDGSLVLSRPDTDPALADGRVWLRWREGASLLWSADAGPDWEDQQAWRVTGNGGQILSLDWACLPGRADAWLAETGQGWLNGMTLGDRDALASRVLASWVSMPAVRPALRPPGRLLAAGGDGRWEFDAAGWRISFVPRADLDDVLAVCKRERLFAVTHTMELRRADGRPFPAPPAEAALGALHMAVSFAAGRWTCPAAPVGIDAAGTAVWANWAPLHCDHAGRGPTGWWAPDRTEDLETVIGAFLVASDGTGGWSTLHYLATAAVVAGESGFVEQRLTLAAAALEHLVWTADAPDRPHTGGAVGGDKRVAAHKRLRKHLSALGVPLTVDPDRTPALAAHLPGLDGPQAVLLVRNRLAHPETPSELYEQPGPRRGSGTARLPLPRLRDPPPNRLHGPGPGPDEGHRLGRRRRPGPVGAGSLDDDPGAAARPSRRRALRVGREPRTPPTARRVLPSPSAPAGRARDAHAAGTDRARPRGSIR